MARTLRSLVCIGILLTGSLTGAVASDATWGRGALDFEHRVLAQRAVEEVYWRHRIWPADNPAPKPPLGGVLPEHLLRAKVANGLRMSNALEALWQRPITGDQLQAELDRMARESRDPEQLRELFTALDNDPFVIAETLARPVLVERLIHNWFADDDRFHGALERQASEALAGLRGVSELPALGGEYGVTRYALREDGAEGPAPDSIVALEPDAWSAWSKQVGTWFGVEALEAAPLWHASGLIELADRFVAVALLARGEGEATVATVTWHKQPFDAWWAEVASNFDPSIETAIGAFSLPAPAGEGAEGCENDSWKHSFFAPLPREGHTAVWTGSEMVVWGGFSFVGGYLNTGGRYVPATDTWTETSTGANTPDARLAHTAVWTGTEMIVWGGDGSGPVLNTGARYNPSTDTWAAMDSIQPVARKDHTAVWTGTEMIVWGGWEPFYGDLDTGARYDPSSDSWLKTWTVDAPAARRGHTAVWTGDEMIVWGGLAGGTRVNTGGRFVPSNNAWTATSVGANVPAERFLHTAVWTGTEMIVWGGAGFGSSLATGGRYAPSTDTWTATAISTAPVGRQDHSAVWTGSEMIVWGGSGPMELNSGGRYVPTFDTWIATSTGVNVPTRRRWHTAVWTGSEMIVWGGDTSSSEVNTGGRFAPGSNTWVATSTGLTPSERDLHTAVWTGNEMIVWGGIHSVGGLDVFQNTGGAFVPSTATWTPTALGDDVPAARRRHTAVWTGSEMIVWGGYSGTLGYTNTGGRYNLAAGTWVRTPGGAGLPSGRHDHTAVWTGTEMIVWGGYQAFGNDPGFKNTGGRYSPSSDAWTPTSTAANVPAARTSHTAVWTGTEMIVWGGSGEDGFVSTGGRYSPAMNFWTATPVAGVPAARSSHTAVWTGSEMIVWGGRVGSLSYTNTGGRYAPSTDGWTATPTSVGVPTGRQAPTAVWTGAEVIVWGGYNSGALDTGARFSPLSGEWTPIPTGTNAPTPRSNHTAVWTGREMIVWGGTPQSPSMGLYCSCICEASCVSLEPDCDADGVHDLFDNCLLTSNTQQDDGDGDGVGDVCDTCVSAANPTQTDGDADGFGDVCDNCMYAPNFTPTVAGFETIHAIDTTQFCWEHLAEYWWVRGDLDLVGSYAIHLSMPSAGAATCVLDPSAPPPPGAGYYHLLRAQCPGASWQSSPGAEPLRDEILP